MPAARPARLEIDRFQKAARQPELVEIPAWEFAMIDGRGDPNTSRRFQSAIGALYGLCYTAKFALKKEGVETAKVGPLEGLWRDEAFNVTRKDELDWTLMIRQPPEMTAELFRQTTADVAAKKGLPEALELRLERFDEGRCAQIMHIGPYSAEAETIAELMRFIEQQGLRPCGAHHEIYLSDPRRTAPERLRTTIRHPVAAA